MMKFFFKQKRPLLESCTTSHGTETILPDEEGKSTYDTGLPWHHCYSVVTLSRDHCRRP